MRPVLHAQDVFRWVVIGLVIVFALAGLIQGLLQL